jgi:hypothetical protein
MFIKDIERVRGGHRPSGAETLARALGVFSLAVGVIELVAPGRISRWLGLKSHRPLLRGYGARELASGAGLVAMRDPVVFVWSRVAGDAMSLATLGLGLRRSRRKANLAIALGSVAAVTALDVACAVRLTQHARQPKKPARDYSSRSGFPMGLQHAFGAAARERKQGLNWQDLWRENQGRGGEHRIELRGGPSPTGGAGGELRM